MRWSLSSFAFACVCLVPTVGPAKAQSAACVGALVDFAHCEPRSRNFQTVLLAIHGWNGDCKSTFGEQNSSLFKLLKEPFYDIDCFQYDSKNTPLNSNVESLRARLVDLHGLGYRQVVFITHSTGGVIALRLLTRLSLNGPNLATLEQTSPLQTTDGSGIRIKAMHAYATPINGLRPWVKGVGAVAQVIFSPETLPDLAPASPYLITLKADMKRLSGLLAGADVANRARLHVPIIFYQGQNEDGIVHDINRDVAEALGWWPYRGELLDSGTGHSHNVGDGGVIGAPKFPAKFMETRALLEMQLMPRLGEVFPMNAPVGNALEVRQLTVVDGISSYARYLFLKAFSPLAEFLKKVVTDAFPRSQKVDDRIMKNFTSALGEATLSDMSFDMAQFCDRLVKEVFAEYRPGRSGDLTRFGEGHSAVAQNVIKMLDDIMRKVEEYAKLNPTVASAFTYSGSLENFRANVVALQARVLDSRFDSARLDAMRSLNAAIPKLSEAEIAKAGLPTTINSFAAQNAAKLGPQDREAMSDIYRNLLGKDATVSTPTLQFLNQPIRWLNQDRPRWTSVLTNAAVEQVLKEPALPDNPEKFVFITDVIKQGGVTGNALPATKLAVEEAKRMLGSAPQGEVKQDWQKQFIEAGKASRYPVIRMDVQRFGDKPL
jgi:hypothetical protein